MTVPELLTLMDGEIERLEADNYHSAAILMRLATEALRQNLIAICDCDNPDAPPTYVERPVQ